MLIDTAVPTVYFIKCSTIQIQLSVFYKRGQYFWIGDDESKHSDPKWFSDIPRGINKYKSVNFFITIEGINFI